MESTGIPGAVHVSATTASAAREQFEFQESQPVNTPLFGRIRTFIVSNSKLPLTPAITALSASKNNNNNYSSNMSVFDMVVSSASTSHSLPNASSIEKFTSTARTASNEQSDITELDKVQQLIKENQLDAQDYYKTNSSINNNNNNNNTNNVNNNETTTTTITNLRQLDKQVQLLAQQQQQQQQHRRYSTRFKIIRPTETEMNRTNSQTHAFQRVNTAMSLDSKADEVTPFDSIAQLQTKEQEQEQEQEQQQQQGKGDQATESTDSNMDDNNNDDDDNDDNDDDLKTITSTDTSATSSSTLSGTNDESSMQQKKPISSYNAWLSVFFNPKDLYHFQNNIFKNYSITISFILGLQLVYFVVLLPTIAFLDYTAITQFRFSVMGVVINIVLQSVLFVIYLVPVLAQNYVVAQLVLNLSLLFDLLAMALILMDKKIAIDISDNVAFWCIIFIVSLLCLLFWLFCLQFNFYFFQQQNFHNNKISTSFQSITSMSMQYLVSYLHCLSSV